MARRAYNDLDQALDAWAYWCDQGRPVMGAGGRSMLARWMDSRGHLIFGGGTAESVAMTLESAVESAVFELFCAAPLLADVLRLEYLAGWREVAERRALGSYDPRGMQQTDIALRLGLSVRTYRRHLAAARGHVENVLTKKGNN